MKLCLLVLLPLACQAANPKCYTGTVKGPGGKQVTKDDLMESLGPVVGASVVKTLNSSPELKAFMKTKGNCQASCLGATTEQAFSTLYGKLGKDFFADASGPIVIEALTGAFRACYPSPPRAALKELATRIFKGFSAPPPTKELAFPKGVKCANAGHEDLFPTKQVVDQFGEAFSGVVNKDKDVKKFFEEIAKACQLPCLEKTVTVAMKTLFLTGQKDEKIGISAITGAMHACFPGVPSKEIRPLVEATVKVLTGAVAKATTKLYAADMVTSDMVTSNSYNFFALGGLATAICLALFSAGTVVGRRWNRSSLIAVEQDEQSLDRSPFIQETVVPIE